MDPRRLKDRFWVRSLAKRAFLLVAEGTEKVLKELPDEEVEDLIVLLRELKLIKPMMDADSRAEDLKIIHRLLDIMEKK